MAPFNSSTRAGLATLPSPTTICCFSTIGAPPATPTITNNGTLQFVNASTAGNATITNNNLLFFNDRSSADNAAITSNNVLEFSNSSTAGTATITNNSILQFFNSSTGGNGTITNNGTLQLFDTSRAGTAIITNNNLLTFSNASTPGNATIITNAAGATLFLANSTAGNARLIANIGGAVDFSGTAGRAGDKDVSAGSIEGAGNYELGGNTLTVGSNDLSTTVSGVIRDGGVSGGTGAALVKVGTGTLTLTGTNTYTGSTTINAGTLQLGNGGATGSIIDNVVDNGVFAINRSDIVIFSSTISGTGSFQQIGPGTTIFTGRQHLYRRHHDQRRHAAARQWWHHRIDPRQCRQ